MIIRALNEWTSCLSPFCSIFDFFAFSLFRPKCSHFPIYRKTDWLKGSKNGIFFIDRIGQNWHGRVRSHHFCLPSLDCFSRNSKLCAKRLFSPYSLTHSLQYSSSKERRIPLMDGWLNFSKISQNKPFTKNRQSSFDSKIASFGQMVDFWILSKIPLLPHSHQYAIFTQDSRRKHLLD